jgi:hypothetical protein
MNKLNASFLLPFFFGLHKIHSDLDLQYVLKLTKINFNLVLSENNCEMKGNFSNNKNLERMKYLCG